MSDRVALYFGFGSGGHFLRDAHGTCEHRLPAGFPWEPHFLDGRFLVNRKVPDDPDGRVHWVVGGRPAWFAFTWWDRSGDKRGASNSGFYVRGFAPEPITREAVEAAAPAAFAFACEQWPGVVSRQLYPLVLQDLPPPGPHAFLAATSAPEKPTERLASCGHPLHPRGFGCTHDGCGNDSRQFDK